MRVKLFIVASLSLLAVVSVQKALAQAGEQRRLVADSDFGLLFVGQSTQNAFLDTARSESKFESLRFIDGRAFRYGGTAIKDSTASIKITFEPPSAGDWTDSVYFKFENSKEELGFEMIGQAVKRPTFEHKISLISDSSLSGIYHGLFGIEGALLYSQTLADSSERLFRRSVSVDTVEQRTIPRTALAMRRRVLQCSPYGWGVYSQKGVTESRDTLYMERILPSLQTAWSKYISAYNLPTGQYISGVFTAPRGGAWVSQHTSAQYWSTVYGFFVELLDSTGTKTLKIGLGPNSGIAATNYYLRGLEQHNGPNLWLSYQWDEDTYNVGNTASGNGRGRYSTTNYQPDFDFSLHHIKNFLPMDLSPSSTGTLASYASGADLVVESYEDHGVSWRDTISQGAQSRLCPIDYRRYAYYSARNFGNLKKWFVGLRSHGETIWEKRLSFLGESDSLHIYSDSLKNIVLTAFSAGGATRINKMNLAGEITYDYYSDSLHLESVMSDDSGSIWAIGNRVNDSLNSALIHIEPLWKNQVAKEKRDFSRLIFPNPAEERIFVDLTLMGEQTVSVVDMLGREVTAPKLGSGQLEVSLKGILPGVYFVKLAPLGKLLKFVVK